MSMSAFEDELKYTEKTCPRCGSILFADMDVCYSCLYDFKRNLEDIEEDIGFGADLAWGGEINDNSDTLPWDVVQAEDMFNPIFEQASSIHQLAKSISADTWDMGLAPSWFERDPNAQADFYEQKHPYVQNTSKKHIMPKLLLQSSDVRCVVPLDKKLLVGRHTSADICLSSPAISKYHVSIKPIGDFAEVSDLGAKNKARYQGRDIQGTIHIKKGDSISICGVLIRLI